MLNIILVNICNESHTVIHKSVFLNQFSQYMKPTAIKFYLKSLV